MGIARSDHILFEEVPFAISLIVKTKNLQCIIPSKIIIIIKIDGQLLTTTRQQQSSSSSSYASMFIIDLIDSFIHSLIY